MDLHIALRMGEREGAQKNGMGRMALYKMHPLQTVYDDHGIGKFVSYEALSASYKSFIGSLQIMSNHKRIARHKSRS